jgi:formylmethanofuran dehydrogenase subunit C
MILRWLDRTTLPVDFSGIAPTSLAGKSSDEVKRIAVPVGNQAVELGDLFEVSLDETPDQLLIEGDLRHVRGIGQGMSAGRLIIRGTAGAHLGAGMSGGTIEVHGDVGEHAGAEMRGGMIRVHGSAGFGLGAAYPGSRIGMRDGMILVDGSTGEEAGLRMRRGVIAIGGDAGDFAGRALVAGSLFVFGNVGRHPGAGMKRGTIALFGTKAPALGPWFAASGRYRFPFLAVALKSLAEHGFPVPADVLRAEPVRYNGDISERGRGEILVASLKD